jgi:putative ABC transport system permease protein
MAGSGPGAARVVSRYERFAALHDAPLVSGVVGGFAIALLVAMAYAAVAVTSVVILHAPRRSRELAFLRTLGLSDRQALALLVVEQGLPVLLAMAIGLGLGVGLAWFLAPGLDLAAFSDPTTAVRLQADSGSLALVAGLVAAVVAAAVAVSTWLGRRLDVAQVLRIGES